MPLLTKKQPHHKVICRGNKDEAKVVRLLVSIFHLKDRGAEDEFTVVHKFNQGTPDARPASHISIFLIPTKSKIRKRNK